jgi:hypothetical protein
MAWHVIRLRMDEQPQIWMVAVKILKKQLQIDNKGVAFQLGVG